MPRTARFLAPHPKTVQLKDVRVEHLCGLCFTADFNSAHAKGDVMDAELLFQLPHRRDGRRLSVCSQFGPLCN